MITYRCGIAEEESVVWPKCQQQKLDFNFRCQLPSKGNWIEFSCRNLTTVVIKKYNENLTNWLKEYESSRKPVNSWEFIIENKTEK